jgi:hypothetical protein
MAGDIGKRKKASIVARAIGLREAGTAGYGVWQA